MGTIKDDDLISVRNRNNGETQYILENGITRTFSINEVKKVPYKELVELSYSVGGRALLEDDLVIENEEALKLLNMNVEPEYFYTEAEIRKVLFEKGYDELADFLDFAPEGAIQIAKDIAVKEEIPDVKKREMLGAKTGLNINNAIMVNKLMEDEEEKKEAEAPKRRVALAEEKDKPAVKERKAAPPKYNVVTTK